ncbi:MAG: manganese-dependent inorganic pyrophosphatase [Candidatus Woesearchaeota archaeon]
MNDDIIIVVGHKNPDTDSVCSAIAYAALKKSMGHNAVPAVQGNLNPESLYVLERFDVEQPEIMTSVDNAKIILVDHNEKAQSLDDINEDNIIEIIDHHKIGDIRTTNPILFINAPIGCTATIIYELYNYHGIAIPDNVKGLLLSAILSDTVIFKSPTCTPKDKEVALKIGEELGIDCMELGKEQFIAKSDFQGKSKEDILLLDSKNYEFGKGKVIVSQVELADTNAIMEDKEAYLRMMRDMMTKVNAMGFVFIVTDIIMEGSVLLVVSDNPELLESAMQIKLDGGSVFVEGLMSRKKQVVPLLEKGLA